MGNLCSFYEAIGFTLIKKEHFSTSEFGDIYVAFFAQDI